MNRKQREAFRNIKPSPDVESSATKLDKILDFIGVPENEKDDFLFWTISTLWEQFKTIRMHRRIDIEEEIKRIPISLPEGTEKLEYEAQFSLPDDIISDIRLEGIEETGLTFSVTPEGDCLIHGIPSKNGKFKLRLTYKTLEGEPISQRTLNLNLLPDPRTLWKNIPADPKIPFYKPDTATAFVHIDMAPGAFPKKEIVAASRRGRAHANEGAPREDDFRVFHCERSDWYILAVADGAEEAKYSRKGAEIACETVMAHCRSKLIYNPVFEQAILDWQPNPADNEKRSLLTRQILDIVYNGARKANQAITGTAGIGGDRVKDYATTLMFVICKKFDFGWFIASFWVGDGAICIFDEKNRTARLLGSPDKEAFSGRTRYLTMPEIFHDKEVAHKRMRMAIVPDFTALYLMTGGVADALFDTMPNLNSYPDLNDYKQWERFYEKLLIGFPDEGIQGVDLSEGNADSKEQLLEWLSFWHPENHADRTMAILH